MAIICPQICLSTSKIINPADGSQLSDHGVLSGRLGAVTYFCSNVLFIMAFNIPPNDQFLPGNHQDELLIFIGRHAAMQYFNAPK